MIGIDWVFKLGDRMINREMEWDSETLGHLQLSFCAFPLIAYTH